ncbi:glycosyltransferase [Paenibacillus sp. FSL H8-0122]|uniref:glycosyltransferase n=1 Tax=Paenibacillus sp. FSL H8-0122 TaxID=2954510 RepID=UPI0030F65C2B
MKILQVNCVYNNGSTGKIMYDIHRGIQENGMESIICYGRGLRVNEPNVYKTSSEILAKFNALRARITGLQYNGALFATNKLIKCIKRENPDIVHLHCINGYFVNIYNLLNFLKRNNIKTVLTLHAEFMHTGSCGYAYECNKWMTGCGNCPQLRSATKSYLFDRTHSAWEKMRRGFEGFNNLQIVSVSHWLENRAKKSPIMEAHNFKVIGNGIDTEQIFYPTQFQYLREKHRLNDEKLILFVTASFSLREDDVKGGRHIVDLAERLIKDNIKIIIIGSRDLTIAVPNNVINVGRINNQKELAAYYSMADLTVLTSERETFSMICAESLSCGTPIVGFKAGAPETIALPDFSDFVEYGDINSLEKLVRQWITRKSELTVALARMAGEFYSKEKMLKGYFDVYFREQ